MASPNRVLLVCDDQDTAELVALALKAHGRLALAGTCPGLSDLAARLTAEPAPAVVVDIDPRPEQTLARLEPLISRFPRVCFVVLAQAAGDNLLFKTMEIGARYFMLKESVAEKLASVLQKLIVSNIAPARTEGSVITVLSAAGGCGATTLAVNLANELQLLTSQSVLLVDMDSSYGAVATCLGLAGQHGLADVLNRDGVIDSELIQSSALKYSEGLYVLLSPASINPAEAPRLAYERLDETLKTCVCAYGYTVIDAPRVPINVAAQLAQASLVALLPFERNVKDIRMAKTLLGGLTDHGVDADVIMPVVTRYRKGGSGKISLDQCKAALGRESLELVSDDFPSAVRCINYGQPLSEAAPRSLLRRELCELARKIVRNERTSEG